MSTSKQPTYRFSATIDIIGINPFVFVPPHILQKIFEQAGKTKGYIPVKGTINNEPYRQTLVKYSGEWRLYINTTMLKHSPQRVGERIAITIAVDNASKEVQVPAAFVAALNKDPMAKELFSNLSPSLKKEISKYLAQLKSEESLARNITRALNFLKGKESFIGRNAP